VELSTQEVEQALERTYKQLVQRVNVPGFRKGKAPRPVVERVVGHDLFLHEATDEAIRWGYRKALDQSRLTPIDQPEIDASDGHEHVQPGQIFQFEATVAVKPEVQLPDYHAIHLERPAIDVSDSDVDALLQDLRERNATLEPTIRAAEIGDTVTMNVAARVDGNEVINEENLDFELIDEEGDEARPHPTFPGLSQQLGGANRGEIREAALHLPELYSPQEWAGETMLVRLLIKEVKRKVLPALDDDFARSISDLETLDALRDRLRHNLELERRVEADEQLVVDAVKEVTTRTFVEIPPVLIDEEVDRMVDDLRSTLERAGLMLQLYLEAAQKTEAELRQEMREDAAGRVKTSLVLEALADAEGIEVSNREVDAALEDLLRGAATTDAERRRLRSSTALRSNLRGRIRRRRAAQRLVEIVTGEEVSDEAAEALADQTAAPAEDNQETVAVEIGG
jgi:trigger factor